MLFFRKMSGNEVVNSRKGIIFGFYVYLLISAVNYFYYLVKETVLMSPGVIFWSGLVAFFAFELILNFKDKSAVNKSH